MFKRCHLILLSILLPVYTVLAQTTLTGQLLTEQKQALPGALVELQSPSNSELTAVTTTDETGRFTLQVRWAGDSLVLSARALGFSEQVRRLANRSQSLRLTLAVSLTPLKEVTIKAPPIRREGDTLSYRVSAFTDKKDRVIADVLRKLPGVEVEADGRILYEGRPIQKFYINGADLLESRYNLASSNLPADAVQDVQVFKRHQPVKALRGVQPTEQASLNLQLKNKVTATGQGRLGAGGTPALWNANLTPMLFTPRQQLLDSYQTNNTGQDVAAELKPLGLGDFQRLREPGGFKPDLTGIQGLGAPPLATSRYLFNRAHLLSANHLLPFSKEAQLRINASFLHDRQTYTGSTRTRFTLPDGPPVTLLETKDNTRYINQFTTDLAYVRNVQRYYLKNTLSAAGSWEAQDGLLARNGPAETATVTQRATNPYYTLSNRLGLVRPAGGQRVVQVNSVLTLAATPQQLSVSPGPLPALLAPGGLASYDQARQQARAESFYTANSVAYITGRQHWHYTYSAGFSLQTQRLSSELTPLLAGPAPAGADTLRNRLRATQGRYYAQAGIDYKTDRWHLELEAPLSYRTFSATDAPLGARQQRRYLTPEPRLSGRYELSGLWHATAGAGFRNELAGPEQLAYGYLLRDYRTLERNAAPLTQTRSWSLNGGLVYENPLTAWFYRASYSFSTSARNQLAQTRVRPDGTQTTVAVADFNRGQNQSVSASASKFVSDWKLSLGLQLNAGLSRQPLLLNGQLTTARNQNGTAVLKANLSAFDWGNLEYTGTLTALRGRVGPEADGYGPGTSQQQQHLALSWYPAERHLLQLATDYYRSQGLGPAVQNVFADATYRHTLPTARKIDVELKATNLLDTRRYQTTYFSSFILVQNDYRLRPRQALVSVRASF
ncbi:TonB-dependent receptor [Hymenobacter psychrophilus]|uniref:Outer membrane protein beta-barrel family protein n=1 Tax=Hymenobacter psychrophilus TaxID=651662 RepID=A0A1H3H5E9_9BACT|nr:TonB-dependent receptor [Hymenobacter psychrophilus]SDY09994.1 Outer membrane protein beta-barrel family protein [Hymenobacter psychrophilus]